MAERDIDEREVKQAVENAAIVTAEATWAQTRAILRMIFIVLAVAAVMWALYVLKGVILMIVLAIFFAYLIAPLVELVHRPFHIRGREHMMPRGLAIALVYLVIFGLLGIAIYFLLPLVGNQITAFAQQVPDYLVSARGRAQSLNNLYQRFQLPPTAREAINGTVTRVIETAGGYVQVGLSSLVGSLAYLPWLILIPILAFFLLKDADSFRRSALEMIPHGRLRWRGDEFFQDVNSTLAAYIRAQLTACLLIGVLCTIGFEIIRLPYALTMGIFAGLLEFIPLAGPLVVGVIAILIASFVSVGMAVKVFLFLIILRIVHDYFFYPRIVGQGIHLHPLAVILAILCGAELAGVAGIFLAIPVIAIVSVTYRHWLEHRGNKGGIVEQLLQPTEEAITAPSSPQSQASVPKSEVKVSP